MSTPSDDHDLDAVREQAAKTLLGGRGRIKAKAHGLTPVQAARRWYGDDTLDTIGATLEQDHVELTDDLLAAIRDGDDGEIDIDLDQVLADARAAAGRADDQDQDQDQDGFGGGERRNPNPPDTSRPHENDTFGTRDPEAPATRASASAEYAEGDKVDVDGSDAVVVEVWTDGEHEGPDGEMYEPTDDSPVYVVGTQDGAEAVSGSDVSASDWGSDVDSPDQSLADSVAGDAEAGRLEASPFDFDIPDSWEESETPNRLILLDAWAGMGGQFDCGGGCCKGTMMSSGMGDRASDRFCAAMKDRVLMWEGWRG